MIKRNFISIIGGAGHVGAPLGLALSSKGFNVILVDKNFKYSHIYSYNLEEDTVTQVTSGNYSVNSFDYSPNGEKIICIFREPQFSPKLLQTVITGTKVKIGTLDPLGVGIESGTELYFTLLNNLSSSLSKCLN